jgi:hypothetical protein
VPPVPPPTAWKDAVTLELQYGLSGATCSAAAKATKGKGLAIVATTAAEVRTAYEAVALGSDIRCILAAHVPSQMASSLASEGVAAFELPASVLPTLKTEKKLTLPKVSAWGPKTPANAGAVKLVLRWLAVDGEVGWTQAGRATAVLPH